MAVFFLAVAGIPLWLVLRRPDFGAAPADQAGQLPATIAVRYLPAEASPARTSPARTSPARISPARTSPVSLAAITADDEAWMRMLAGLTR
jgi:hypothetical protein